ncbi:MAG: short-chain dehydrogenase [Rhizobiales bacterium 12-68-15]|nr:MAG: short-chain dehydrogenase [Rhizobiales bacterium 12-68-15]
MDQRKIALVTGGASGIGEACVVALAEKGWRVIVSDVRADAAEATATRLGVEALPFDVADEAAIAAAAEAAEDRFGPVSGLVTSAGVLQPPTAPEDFGAAEFDRVMSVNLRGTYLTAVAFGSRMARRGTGAIVTIGSVTSLRAVPLHAYGPSKAAVAALTRRSGVRINCISPGYVATPPLQKAIDAGQRDPHLPEEAAAMGRLVRAEEIGKVAAFLLSEEASAVTGINMPVDCGWLVGSHMGTYGGVRPARA